MSRARILADYVSSGDELADKLDLSGGAMTGAITTNSTFDGVDVGVRDAILTSTTTLATAAAPKASPAFTGSPSITLGSDATGDLYYRAAGGALTRLATGADGTVLTSTGAASVPAFEAATVASPPNSFYNAIFNSNCSSAIHGLTGTGTSSSSAGSGYEGWRAWDGRTEDTNPASATYGATAYGVTAWSISFIYDSDGGVAKYWAYAPFGTSSSTSQQPDNYTFQGSPNGSSWTTISTHTSQGGGHVDNVFRLYDISSNTTSYKHYKMDITSVSTGSSYSYFRKVAIWLQ